MTALARLARDRRGAISVIGAFCALLIAGGMMLIADVARVELLRQRLQRAADAATLAAARELGGGEPAIRALARQIFDANMGSGYAGGALDAFAVRFLSSASAAPGEKDVVRVQAEATLPLYTAALPRIFRPAALKTAGVSTASAAIKRMMGAEIALVLDNTGSMQGGKIGDLRAAAQTLVDALFQGRDSVPDLFVGVVPYSAAVNVGRQHAAWLDAPLAQVDAAAAPALWKGCVMARSVALAETDAPPEAGARLEARLWPSSRLSTDPDVFDAFHKDSPNVWPQTDADGAPRVDERQAARNAGFGPNLGCPAPITPPTAAKAALDDAIEGLQAWHRGGTMSNLGLVWAWRLLSPRWRGLWRAPDGAPLSALPFDYDKPFNNKIVVLMTDGDNLIYKKDWTAYRRPGDMIGDGDVDASMTRLCAALKRVGVIVYAITFGSGVDAGTRRLFADCASDPLTETRIPGRKYFHAPTGDELTETFGAIAGQIQDLRLIE